LIELMVASFVAALLMLEVWGLVRAGAQFYKRARGQSESQRNALMALRWIGKDLAEGSTLSFRQYQTVNDLGATTGFAHTGIVFGSPSVPGVGGVSYDDSGHMVWSSVIGYYIDPGDHTLYRQMVPLEDPATFPPVIDDDTQSTDVMATLPNPRVVARGIKDIKTQQGPKDVLIELISRDEDLGFGIKVQTRLEMKN
jgi:hypothetical protein